MQTIATQQARSFLPFLYYICHTNYYEGSQSLPNSFNCCIFRYTMRELKTEILNSRVTPSFKVLLRRVGLELGLDDISTIQYCVADVAKRAGLPLIVAAPTTIKNPAATKKRSNRKTV